MIYLDNPEVYLADSAIDRTNEPLDRFYIPFHEISVIRDCPSRKQFLFYLKNNHKFRCLASNPDQYTELGSLIEPYEEDDE